MSDKELRDLSQKIKHGLELAERKMIEEKALYGESIIVSSDGETFQSIPAKQLVDTARP